MFIQQLCEKLRFYVEMADKKVQSQVEKFIHQDASQLHNALVALEGKVVILPLDAAKGLVSTEEALKTSATAMLNEGIKYAEAIEAKLQAEAAKLGAGAPASGPTPTPAPVTTPASDAVAAAVAAAPEAAPAPAPAS